MDDLNVLSYSLKFVSYYHQMEYGNHDMFQRGRLCQICELSHMPLRDATWRSYEQIYCHISNGNLKEHHLVYD